MWPEQTNSNKYTHACFYLCVPSQPTAWWRVIPQEICVKPKPISLNVSKVLFCNHRRISHEKRRTGRSFGRLLVAQFKDIKFVKLCILPTIYRFVYTGIYLVLVLTMLLKFPPPQPSPHIGRTPEPQTELVWELFCTFWWVSRDCVFTSFWQVNSTGIGLHE